METIVQTTSLTQIISFLSSIPWVLLKSNETVHMVMGIFGADAIK